VRNALLVVIVALTLNGGARNATAQGRQRAQAITDPVEGGIDYQLQGEYAGWLTIPDRGPEYAGLQVVALGDGGFDAVHYRGGLPGNGWDRGIKSRYSGKAAKEKVELTGAKNKFIVDGHEAVVLSEQNRELGRLTKVTRTSPTMGLAPQPGAMVLFDGSISPYLEKGKPTSDGLLLPEVMTKMPVGAFRLHLEFRTPFMPAARGQARGNSGVYIQRRYEVQVLDSFGLEGAENECGGLYRQIRPDLNMCLPPLTWQTYDIWFTPARFAADGTTKLTNAQITVLHNGVPVHWYREITAKTGGGRPEGPEPLPIQLQDHGNPVAFRNVWIVMGGGGYSTTTDGYQQASYQHGRFRWLRRRW